MVTTEAFLVRSGLKALATSINENAEMAVACKKSARLVSWKGLNPSL